MQQDQFKPVSLAEEILLLYALRAGRLLDLDEEGIKKFRKGIFGFVASKHSSLVSELENAAELTPDLVRSLDVAMDQYFESQQED